MLRIVVIVGIALALGACDKNIDIPVTVHHVDASNVVLVSRIDETTAVGDPVRLKRTSQDGCTLLGTVTKDFGIDVKTVECGDKVVVGHRADWHIPLSRTHTFTGADGRARPGYGGGETFVVPDAGIDFAKLYKTLTKE